MSTIIQVEHLSKSYRISHQGREPYLALRDVLTEGARNIGRRILHPTRAATHGRSFEDIWALKDVSFEVKPGDRVGIIGRNGAGKSTLLKILSRITEPTAGRVRIRGRVASLLEVGTGFHPELTGRENIFLNGAILGMKRAEIIRKFEEIVSFAEVEKFLDTPVKRYSSGMYVRLAFAVAVHLDTEIINVDEVLAVGDGAFQRKSLNKMRELAGEGRTVLFVSHNIEAVQRLCNKGILLDKGKLMTKGNIIDVTKSYIETLPDGKAQFPIKVPKNPEVLPAYAYKMQIEDAKGNLLSEVTMGEHYKFRIFFKANRKVKDFVIAIGLTTVFGLPVRTTWSQPNEIEPGEYIAVFHYDGIIFASGQYNLIVGLSNGNEVFQYIENAGSMTISEVSGLLNDARIVNTKSGLIINQMDVDIIKNDDDYL